MISHLRFEGGQRSRLSGLPFICSDLCDSYASFFEIVEDRAFMLITRLCYKPLILSRFIRCQFVRVLEIETVHPRRKRRSDETHQVARRVRYFALVIDHKP